MTPVRDIDLDNFTVNLASLPHTFWTALGEAKSKVEHIKRAPLQPETWQELAIVYLVKGVHSTTAIEGNTLTEDEVMAIYKQELTLPPSREYQVQEVRNIIAFLTDALRTSLSGTALTTEEICNMNARVLANLQVPDHVTPGVYRSTSVGVGRYRCPPPAKVPQLVEKMVKWYNDFTELGLDPIMTAITKAIAAHVYFVLIHPFADGNGRTARLIEWRTLDASEVPTIVSHLLSNYYNLTRTRYYEMLDVASRGGNMTPFFCYAVNGFVEQLSSQLQHLHEQYENLIFLDMLNKKTPGVAGEVVRRREKLAIAICSAPGPVPKDKLTQLTPELAAAYAVKQERALARDLSALEKAKLIELTGDGWIALLDTMYWRHRRDR